MHSFGTFWGGLGMFWSNSGMLKSQPVKKVEVEFPKSHSINLLNWLQSSSNSVREMSNTIQNTIRFVQFLQQQKN